MDQKAGARGRKAVQKIIHAALESGTPVLDEALSRDVLRAYGIPVPEQGAGAKTGGAVGHLQLLVGMKRDRAFGPVFVFGLGGAMAEVPGNVVLKLAPTDGSVVSALQSHLEGGGPVAPLADLPEADQQVLLSVVEAVSRLATDHPEIVEIDVHPAVCGAGKPVVTRALVALAPPPEAKKPDRRAFKPNMAALLAPRSVAVVGASGEMSKWGGSVLSNIVEGGYTGKVYAVNPKGGVFFGVHAHLSIEALPEPPDLVLLAVARPQIEPLLHECIRKRVGAVIVMPCGSCGAPEGAEVRTDDELAQIAKVGGVTLIGSDCLGLVSNEVGLHAIGSIELHPLRGGLSIVSQSGDVGALVAKACERHGIGIDKFASVDGEVQIGVVEVLDYLREDPNTACIMVCLEGLEEGARFVEACARTTAQKPVVVMRTGMSEQGSGPALSQSGAAASSAAVWSEAVRQAGLVGCNATDELIVTGACFANLPLPQGRRVAVVGQRKGAGSLAVDEIARSGLIVAELPKEVRTILEQIADSWGGEEPLDSAAKRQKNLVSKVLKPTVESDQVDAVILVPMRGIAGEVVKGRRKGGGGRVADPAAWSDSMLKSVGALMESTGKPIIPVPARSVRSSVFDFGMRFRPVVLSSAKEAAQTLARMERYASQRREKGL